MDAVARMKNPDATQVLLSLVDDADVDGHAVAALARRKDAPRAVFVQHLQDARPWVRKVAAREAARRQ
jgi:hypothetical protein